MKAKNRRSPQLVAVGRRYGQFVVVRVLREKNADGSPAVRVRCENCGHEEERGSWTFATHEATGGNSCVKCRWKVHRVTVPCSRGCGAMLDRPDFKTNQAICDDCRRIESTAAKIRRRALALGRACRTCERTDADAPFAKTDECCSCNRAAMRNGRCRCHRAVLKTKDCRCGRKATTSLAGVAANARRSRRLVRGSSGRFEMAPERERERACWTRARSAEERSA